MARGRRTEPSSRLATAQVFWPFVRDVGATMMGAFILIDQTVIAKSAQTILVVAGMALLGVPASGLAQRLLQRYVDQDPLPPQKGGKE